MSSYESGFGSPLFNPPTLLSDAGFGDPAEYSEENEDTGFGSPAEDTNVFTVNTVEIGEDGGASIVVLGSFLKNLLYTVKFVGGGFEYIAYNGYTTKSGAFTLDGNSLKVYAPRMAKGLYSITINDGLVSSTLLNAVRVIERSKSKSTVSLRRSLPGFYKAGPRETFEAEPEFTGLSALVSSIGSIINEYHGKPCTNMREQWNWGDNVLQVDSTLNFGLAGELRIGTHLFRYTGKTVNTFTGVTIASVTSNFIAVAQEVTPK